MSRITSLLVFLPVLFSCAAAPARDAGPTSVETLLEADRAFCADALEHGLDGWVAWFHPQAVKVPPVGELPQGLDEVRAESAPLFEDSAIQLRWEPEVGAMILPGELGLTRGGYELVQVGADEPVVLATGTYVTVWTWTSDGWRVALDGELATPSN